jgi:hypothetical protein
MQSKCFVIEGGSSERSVLYMATLVTTQFNPVIGAFYQRLLVQDKAKNFALFAWILKLLLSMRCSNIISPGNPNQQKLHEF